MIAVLIVVWLVLVIALLVFLGMPKRADHDAAQLEAQWNEDELIDQALDDDIHEWRRENYPDITTD